MIAEMIEMPCPHSPERRRLKKAPVCESVAQTASAGHRRTEARKQRGKTGDAEEADEAKDAQDAQETAAPSGANRGVSLPVFYG
jgi:hypothetical protein